MRVSPAVLLEATSTNTNGTGSTGGGSGTSVMLFRIATGGADAGASSAQADLVTAAQSAAAPSGQRVVSVPVHLSPSAATGYAPALMQTAAQEQQAQQAQAATTYGELQVASDTGSKCAEQAGGKGTTSAMLRRPGSRGSWCEPHVSPFCIGTLVLAAARAAAAVPCDRRLARASPALSPCPSSIPSCCRLASGLGGAADCGGGVRVCRSGLAAPGGTAGVPPPHRAATGHAT